jgi:hypothetical protein
MGSRALARLRAGEFAEGEAYRPAVPVVGGHIQIALAGHMLERWLVAVGGMAKTERTGDVFTERLFLSLQGPP